MESHRGRFLLNMSRMFVESSSNLCQIFVESSSNVGYSWIVHKILECVSNMNRIYQFFAESLSNLYRIWWICVKCSSNLCRTFVESPSNICLIFAEYVSNSCGIFVEKKTIPEQQRRPWDSTWHCWGEALTAVHKNHDTIFIAFSSCWGAGGAPQPPATSWGRCDPPRPPQWRP